MRAAACLPPLALLLMTAGCDRHPAAEAVEQNYDNRADAIDRTAAAQPNVVAKKIYRDQADAVREEGKDRAEGLEKADAQHAPPIPTDNSQ